MYGYCQASDTCTKKATHTVQFRNQPRNPMYVCSTHARQYRAQIVEAL